MYETPQRHSTTTVYKAGVAGGIIGFLLSMITQFWPQICAVLHFCVATPK